jgi:hypothetical protein
VINPDEVFGTHKAMRQYLDVVRFAYQAGRVAYVQTAGQTLK